jgi:hypothetical protein
MWRLYRLGLAPDGVEIEELPVKLRRIVTPQSPEGRYAFGQRSVPLGPWERAVIAQFLLVPPDAHAKLKSTV